MGNVRLLGLSSVCASSASDMFLNQGRRCENRFVFEEKALVCKVIR